MYFVEAYSINDSGAPDTSQGIVIRAVDFDEAKRRADAWATTILSGFPASYVRIRIGQTVVCHRRLSEDGWIDGASQTPIR
jgi:hypothetical protein